MTSSSSDVTTSPMNPIVALVFKKSDGWSLVDGSHRMAAFEMLQAMTDAELKKNNIRKPRLEQEVWVGTHSAGEVPDG